MEKQGTDAPLQAPVLFAQALPDIEHQPISARARADELVAAANRAVIDSPQGVEQGATLDKMIQTQLKKLDDERTSWVKPLNDYVKRINARFRLITEPLEAARQICQRKMIAFKREQDRLAAEAAEKARKEAEEAALAKAEKLEAQGKTEQAEAVLAEAADAPPPAIAVPTGPVRSEIGAVSSFVDDPKWEVTDPTLVPREWLCVDEKKLNQAVKKEGVREIPGLKIWVDQRMVTR